jgi:ribosomal-protein-serine acetyltransferase
VILRADERTALRSTSEDDAAPMFALIEANRAHLRRWLAWVDAVREPAHTREFLRGVAERETLGTSLDLAILHDGELAGVAGFRSLDPANRSGEIGYWLPADREGRGIMTACCRALVRHGFDSLGLNRIVIAAAVENARSRGVAERLGFRLEGVHREAEWLYDRFVDHAVYSLLRRDTLAP